MVTYNALTMQGFRKFETHQSIIKLSPSPDTKRMFKSTVQHPHYTQHTLTVALKGTKRCKCRCKCQHPWTNYISLNVNSIPYVTSLSDKPMTLTYKGIKFTQGWLHGKGKPKPVIMVDNGNGPYNTRRKVVELYVYTEVPDISELPLNASYDNDLDRIEWRRQQLQVHFIHGNGRVTQKWIPPRAEQRWIRTDRGYIASDYEWQVGDVFLNVPEDNDDTPAISHERSSRIFMSETDRLIYESNDYEFQNNGGQVDVLEQFEDFSIQPGTPHIVLPPKGDKSIDLSDWPLRGFLPAQIDNLLEGNEDARERLMGYLIPHADGRIYIPAKTIDDQRDADISWICRRLRNKQHYDNSFRYTDEKESKYQGEVEMARVPAHKVLTFYARGDNDSIVYDRSVIKVLHRNHYKTRFTPKKLKSSKWASKLNARAEELAKWADGFVDDLRLVADGKDEVKRFYLDAIRNRQEIDGEDPVAQVRRLAKGIRELSFDDDGITPLAGSQIPMINMLPVALRYLGNYRMQCTTWCALLGAIYLELERCAAYVPTHEVEGFSGPVDWLVDHARELDPFYHLVMRQYNGDKDISIEEIREKLVEFYTDDTDPMSEWTELDSHYNGQDIDWDNDIPYDPDRRVQSETTTRPTHYYRYVWGSDNQSWQNDWSSREATESDNKNCMCESCNGKVTWSAGPNLAEDTHDHIYHT